MGIHLTELMMLGLVLWTAIGAIGLVIARRRGERARFRRGLATIGAVWIGYSAVLVGVSLRQPVPVIEPGRPRCFGHLCFAVVRVEEVEGFWVRGQERERLVRVGVSAQNRGVGRPESEAGLEPTLIDAEGRRWEQVPGLSGVRLTAAVAAGSTTVSEPVFRVAKDATGLRLILHHTHWTPAKLVIGDPESYFHRPAEMVLPPPSETTAS